MNNEQEGAAEQQHLHTQPGASPGTGHGTGSTRCTARLRAAFCTALQIGETALPLRKGKKRSFGRWAAPEDRILFKARWVCGDEDVPRDTLALAQPRESL